MALPVYVEISGKKQGKFTGGCRRKGREGMMEAIQIDHDIKVPTDALTGDATGKRRHGPMVFRKEIDKASPQLLQALVNNETVTEMKLHFWTVTPQGQEREFYTITLTDGRIVDVETMLPNIYDNEKLHPQEQVAVTYSKIEWLITDGNIVAMDDWYQPV